MRKIIRLTESDLARIVKRVIKEQQEENRKLKPTQPTTMPPFSPRPLPQYQPPVKKTIKLRRPKPKDDDDEKEE